MDQVAIDASQFQALTSPKIQMIEPGGGVNLWVLGVLVTLKVLGNETGNTYSLFTDKIPPGAGPPIHIHTLEDESWYVLDGELTWTVGDREFHATKGSFLHLPRLVPHTFSNKFDKPAEMLVTYAPAGFETWFLEVGIPVVDSHKPPSLSEEKRQEAVQLMRKYGLIVPGMYAS